MDHPSPTRSSPGLSALGFLVTSPDCKFLCANEEARSILAYPGRQTRQSIADGFEKKLRRRLLGTKDSQSGANWSPPTIQFKSGRRTYFCRAFFLDDPKSAPEGSTVLVVLERGTSGSCALSQITQEFHLTRRERETVTLLLQGLGNKEIAERLGISVNTVKAFLRSVMIKMGVCGRSRIVSKVLGLVLSTNGHEQELG